MPQFSQSNSKLNKTLAEAGYNPVAEAGYNPLAEAGYNPVVEAGYNSVAEVGYNPEDCTFHSNYCENLKSIKQFLT